MSNASLITRSFLVFHRNLRGPKALCDICDICDVCDVSSQRLNAIDMSCTTCQSKFTFFTRENGCPNCGFSYCSKCLKYKCNLPSGQTKKVCGPCYNKLAMSVKGSSGESSASELPSPQGDHPIAPLDIINKMEALENPVKPPIVIYKRRTLDNLKVGLEPADQEILERLKKLKDEDKQPPPPSIDEIRRRLAILKDQDPDASQQSVNIHQTDTRTDQQKEDDLIREYLENLELSSGSDPAKDVEARLNALKGLDPSAQSPGSPPEDEDEETVTKNLIKRALDEAALEAKYEAEELEPPEEMDVEARNRSSDDESTCCMCEQTTDLVECAKCTGDLYCDLCFYDNHDESELKWHKPSPHKRGKTATPD